MSDLETVALAMLEAVNGGALPSLGSLWDRIKPMLPAPTIPLGPFVPPKPDPRIA